MKVTIERLPAQQVVFMRRVGPYGPENFQLMSALKQWAEDKDLLKNSTIYGIAQDNMETPPEKCRYDVCLVAPAECAADDAVQKGEIPGGKYAVFAVGHTAEEVKKFWASVEQHLKENGLLINHEKPILERYSYKMVEKGLCEFCVPLMETAPPKDYTC